jgi:opacity protein-like surface antigen
MLKKATLAALFLVPTMASAQPYLIAGAGVGSTDMEFVENVFDPGFESDDELQRAVIGFGFKANENLALEAVYLSQADAKVSGTVLGLPSVAELDHQGVQLGLIAAAPLTPQFSVYGKLTGNLLDINLKLSAMGTPLLDDNDADLYFGLGAGVQVQVNDRVGLRLGVERTIVREFADYSDGDFDIDQATLALQFGF